MKRIEEHESNLTPKSLSTFCQIQAIKVSFNNPRILISCPEKYKLSILTCTIIPAYIQKLLPHLNLDSASYPLYFINA